MAASWWPRRPLYTRLVVRRCIMPRSGEQKRILFARIYRGVLCRSIATSRGCHLSSWHRRASNAKFRYQIIQMEVWRETRRLMRRLECVTAKRLPAVGAFRPRLFLLATALVYRWAHAGPHGNSKNPPSPQFPILSCMHSSLLAAFCIYPLHLERLAAIPLA
jgi:hypothetical protein